MFILTFLGSKLGKYILLILALISALTAIYLKGRHDANVSRSQKENKETIRRVETERKVIDRARKIHRKVDQARKQVTPIERDSIDSCILSNDSVEVDCAEPPSP